MIYVNLALENSDLSGIVCRESASRIHNLSSFPEYPIIIQQKEAVDIETRFIHFVYTEVFDLYHTRKIRDGLYVTSPERTIVDLLIHQGEEKFIDESVQKYALKNHHKLYELFEVAAHYKVENELAMKLYELIGMESSLALAEAATNSEEGMMVIK